MVQVTCPHGCFWKNYDNLTSGKSRGCPKCKTGLAYATKLERVLAKRYDGAVQRCTNPNNPEYKNYGGRGIRVDFDSAREYAAYCSTLPNASIELEIDRIDNDGNYAKGNLRFSTSGDQKRNKRNNHKVIYDGNEMCLQDFVLNHTKLSITRAAIYLARGHTPEEVASMEPKLRGRAVWRLRHPECGTESPVCNSGNDLTQLYAGQKLRGGSQ